MDGPKAPPVTTETRDCLRYRLWLSKDRDLGLGLRDGLYILVLFYTRPEKQIRSDEPTTCETDPVLPCGNLK